MEFIPKTLQQKTKSRSVKDTLTPQALDAVDSGWNSFTIILFLLEVFLDGKKALNTHKMRIRTQISACNKTLTRN